MESVNGRMEAIINPATENVIAEVPVCTEEDVNVAVEAAQKAFDTWGETTPAERSQALLKLAEVIEEHSDDFAKVESENVGKPLQFAKGEVVVFVDNIRFFAGAARALQGLATGEYVQGHTSMIRRDPIGVVGSIAPWNYPLMMAGWKIGPALAAGNTVVLKPSEITPLTTLLLAELSADVLPPGILNVVTGYGDIVGSSIVRHPKVNMVSLTGSVRAGKTVAREAAESLKKVHLELGGKAPVIVYDDADIPSVIDGVKLGGFYNSGQDCTAATRLYVSEKIYEPFVSELVSAVKNIKVGDPLLADTEMGPLVSNIHRQRVAEFVNRAKNNSHIEVLTGGSILDGPGFYYQPTVIAGALQTDEIIQQEVFGPVITVTSFKDDQEVVMMANDCQYALAASVWTKNIDRALRAIKKLKFGTVWVNEHFVLVSEMPHGGSKMSGYGKDQSVYSIEEYTEVRHAMIKFE